MSELKPKTRHYYRKRIRDLEAELNSSSTRQYELMNERDKCKRVLKEIFIGICDMESNSVNRNWLLKKFRDFI